MKASILVVLLFSFLLFSCSAERTEADYLNNAKHLVSVHKDDAALIELKNALKLNSNNFEAHQLLGELFLRTGAFNLALVEFKKLNELGAERNLWAPLIVKAMLMQGMLTDVLSFDIESLSDSKVGLVFAYQAQAAIAMGDFNKAQLLIDKAEISQANLEELSIAKARLLLRKGDVANAKSLLNDLLKVNPNQFDGLLLLADIEEGNKEFDLAENLYSKALLLRPKMNAVLIRRTKLRLTMEHFKQAQSDIDILMTRMPKNSLVNYLQGLLYTRTDKTDEALPFVERATMGNVPVPEAVYLAALTYLNNNELERSNQYSQQLQMLRPGTVLGALLKANIRLKQGKYDESNVLVEHVLATLPKNISALNIKAANFKGQGRKLESLTILKQVITLAPQSSTAHINYAMELLEQGDFEEGFTEVSEALSIEPDNEQAINLLVKTYINRKEFQKAADLVIKQKGKFPHNAFPFVLEGQLYLAQENVKKAIGSFKSACDLASNNFSACMTLAALEIKEKRFDSAMKTYDNILDRKINHLQALIGKANLFATMGSLGETENMLNKAMDEHPTSIQATTFLGRFYFANGRADKAMVVLSSAPKFFSNDIEFLKLLAATQLELGKFNESLVTTKKILMLEPINENGLLLSALANNSLGNRGEAVLKLRQLLKISPKNMKARVEIAHSLFKQGEVSAAKKEVALLNAESKSLPTVLELRSGIERVLGQNEEARSLAKQLFDVAPSSSHVLFYAQNLWQDNMQEQAFELLEDWLLSEKSDLFVKSELASLYLISDKKTRALTLFEEILKASPENVAALNNIAWEIKKTDPVRALKLASKLVDLRGDVAPFLDTLAMVQLHNDLLEQATRNIEKALAIRNTPSSIYHKAIIDSKRGEWLVAIKALSILLEQDIDFSEKKEAEKLLQNLKEGS